MVEITTVLDKLEAFGLLKQKKRTGNYMTITCPFHGDGQEKKPSCGVLLVDEVRGGNKYPAGLFHCFTCHYSKKLPDAVNDLLKLNKIEKSGIDWLKENIPGFDLSATNHFDYLIPQELTEELTNKLAIDYINLMTKPKKPQYITEAELAKYRFTIPYMYDRKLTDEIIEKYDVGYQADWIPPGRKRAVPCITFPVRDRDGNTLFLCRRSVEGKLFNYPQGVVKPVYGIYELPQGCKSVIICESIFNALTCVRYGLPAVALLGTGNSYQMQQLRELGVREFVLCMDGDEAGQAATEKLKKALQSNAIIWTVHMLDGHDVNDLDEQTFMQLYEDRD